ncbi:predicted protein [Naegleria gruberi]|uniref:Predicted protein n=1 Tax=Naegleria gruberi TaxID=5762 RepID=D2UX45_NAEGR|nr:uncharacterized protein NAEGRDRAFT_45282 [Naegleria gruberi]EFC50559.1 predicted protein [Naegleria gruberi]|eukprot:XP_002683303.1 predicted protein [Naegleria gruberi strain NEG-M]
MLCILLDNSRIEIYGESGRSFIVSLPCKMSKIWSLNDEYLLVERKIVNPDPSSTIPIIYYLTHPLEDLKALASVVDNQSNDMEDDILMTEPIYDYLKSEEEVIAYIFLNLFMITFNTNTKILSIYSIMEEGFVQRIPYADNNDFSDYLKCNLETVQISIFPQNNFGTEYTLFLINNNSLFAFTIFRNDLEEAFILKPKFFKEGVVSISEFNYPLANETLFNGNIEGFLHLMILAENSNYSLILVLDGEFIMWEQALDSQYSKIEHLVDNRLSLKTADYSLRYRLDICPNSKLVQDCLSVFQSVLTKDLFSSIFYDFQTSRIGNANDWDIFINLLNYLTFGVEPNSPTTQESDPWKLMELIHTKNSATSSQIFNTSKLRTNKQVLIQNLPLILISIHLLYENYKLHTSEWNNVETLVRYLFNLSNKLKWKAFSEVYQRDFNYTLTLTVPSNPVDIEFPVVEKIKFLNNYYTTGIIAPTILGWIEEIFINKSLNVDLMYPSITNCSATSLSRKICRFFSLLVTNKEDLYNVESNNNSVSMDINGLQTGLLDLPPHERVAIALLQEGFSSVDGLSFLPFSVSLPIREALVQCRNSIQPVTRTPEYCKLIEREDLAVNNQAQSESEVLLDGNQIVSEFTKTLGTGVPSIASNQDSEDDIGHMIWSEDRRLEQVSKMLDSSIPTQIQKHTLQLSEDDLDGFDPNDAPELQRKILLNMKQQVLSFCIGRGMLSIASKKNNNSGSVSNDTTSNILTIPPIVLSSKLKRNRAIMTIDVSKIVPENEISASCSTQWAEFHNGVASGLTIGRDSKITKEWIMFHKPNKRAGQFMNKTSNDSVSHAGLLLALGLQGHLTCLGPTDIYGYLQQRHEATTIGILLGLSCSYIGTQDQYITRSLSLYVPSLVVGMSDMEMPMEVSGAALVGIGLLYMGSGHRFMTEVLLGELARPPNDNSTNSRESYSLSAGFALGYVHLAKGANGSSHELKMDQRLLSYMTGGSKRPEFDTFAMMASKSKSQMIQKGGKGQNTSEFVNTSCSRIKENEKFVNVDVTGQGACIALTLKYLKTHDLTIASEMKVPDTKYMLDYVRPDMIILRIVGSSLIMWDHIKNTDEWIKSKLPGVLNNTAPISIVESSELSKIYAYSVSGCCMAIGLKYAGSHDTKAYNLLLGLLQQVIKSKLKIFLNNEQMQIPYSVNLDKYTTDRATTVILLSICCVMAGSGNIEVIRIIKSLRQKYVASPATQQGGYGIHMALSMSLGLLFLGGGRCSLSTNDRSIAALLCSIYPIFPQTTTDNRYHSQALRHMYILSTENRLIETVDIDTKERCHVPIQIETTHGDVLHKLSPCLIPEAHLLKKITTMNERRRCSTVHALPQDPQLGEAMFTSFTFPPRKPGHDVVDEVLEEMEEMNLNEEEQDSTDQ